MKACVAIAAIALAGSCQFDEGGVRGGDDDGPPGDAGPTTPDAAVAAVDAARADAAVPCTDRDRDGYLAVGIADSDCGEVLDCDDDDERAFPGQGEYFDTPRTSGGFDFDCDGDESPLDSTEGGACREEWWNCLGTGWVGGVPACGNPGSWHVCADQSGCTETSSTNTRMSCR